MDGQMMLLLLATVSALTQNQSDKSDKATGYAIKRDFI